MDTANTTINKTARVVLVILPALWTALLCMHSYMGMDLLTYISPAGVFSRLATSVQVLLKAVGNMFSHDHPGTGNILLFTVIFLVFLAFLRAMKKLIEQRKLVAVIGILAVFILVMDVKLILAHRTGYFGFAVLQFPRSGTLCKIARRFP